MNIIKKVIIKLKNVMFVKKLSQKNNTSLGTNIVFENCELINGRNNKISIGDNCCFKNCKFHFFSERCSLIIGNNNYFNDVDFWFQEESTMNIGNNNMFAGKLQIAAIENKTVNIGNDCMFLSAIHIRTGDSHPIYDLSGKQSNVGKDITIKDRVWIGQNFYILKGSLISSDSVVGCCSVVTKEFNETNCVIAGSPAKIVKNNISQGKGFK